jgi:hypothetical protein
MGVASPSNNRVQIVGNDNIQFTKAPKVLRGMGLSHLTKNERAKGGIGREGHVSGGELMR